MSTAVTTFNPAQLPTFAKGRTSVGALTKALAGGGEGGFAKRISIKGGVFRLVVSGKEVAQIDERFLDVVIVNAAPKISRVYYAKEWKADEAASAPSCWSSDGDAPDKEVANKQSVACANCPQNVKGSGNGDTRACRYQHRIAVVLANDMEGDIMQVALPAKSLFGKEENGLYPLQSYARWLASQNIEANEVVTRMRFDTSVESPKLFFKTMRWLSDEEFEMASEQSKKPDAVEAVKLTVSQVDGGKPEDKEQFEQAKPEKAPPAAKAAPPDPDEEPPPPPPAKRKAAAGKAEKPAEEPVVRKGKDEAKPPAERASISKLVDEWDTDD